MSADPFVKASLDNWNTWMEFQTNMFQMGMQMMFTPLTAFSGTSYRSKVRFEDQENLMSPTEDALPEDDIDREMMELESMTSYFQDLFSGLYGEWESPQKQPLMYEVENLPEFIGDYDSWEFNMYNPEHDAGLMVRIGLEDENVEVETLLRYGEDESVKGRLVNPESQELYDWVGSYLDN